MKRTLRNLTIAIALLAVSNLSADEVKASKAKSWDLSGRVQLQHVYDTNAESDASRTNNGYRIRRARIQTKVSLTDFVSAKIQFDIRDNSPRLKDAEGKIKLFNKKAALRFGQFKVPVWREELRSSSKLMLVERSGAAEFLADSYLSARHIGLELAGALGDNVSYAVNYSNGAGEGGREDAGRSKDFDTNNGKMLAARVNAKLGKVAQVGASFASNKLGSNTESLDNSGNASVIAPDFGIYLDNGVEIEGGIAFGKWDKMLAESADDVSFQLLDITAGWTTKLNTPSESLGGIDKVGLALGFTSIDGNTDIDDNESTVIRFGPVFYFGKNTRLQINGESESFSAEGVDSVFKIRSQFTVNL